MSTQDKLAEMLGAHREDLVKFVHKNANQRLKRYEPVDDIVQGLVAQAMLAAERFEYRSDPEFFAWMYQVARRYMSDREAYWSALKRRSTHVLRIAAKDSGAAGTAMGLDPPDHATSPSSFASRKEQLVLVSRALNSLLPRDQDLLRWSSESVPIAEMAERLEISYEAAERARLRAFDRLRKAYSLLVETMSDQR